jgi:hypothetical protein
MRQEEAFGSQKPHAHRHAFFGRHTANRAMITQPENPSRSEDKQMEMLVLSLVEIFSNPGHSFIFKSLW